MNPYAARQRLQQLNDEVRARFKAGTITNSYMDAVEAESEQLDTVLRSHKAALGYSGSTDPYPYGGPADAPPGAFPRVKMLGVNNEQRVAPPTPLALDDSQIDALWMAAKNKTAFRVEIGSAGLEHQFGGQLRDKAVNAVSLSGLNNQLPPIQIAGPRGNYGLPYEPFRVFSALPTVAMTGPGAAYLQHTGNANEATGVAEGGVKPSLGPTVTETYIRAQKIAGTVEATLEILQDHEEFAAFLPAELARSVYNAENLYLLQAGFTGGPTGSAFKGLLGVTGTLARAMATDSPLDAISKAFVDLRTGSAYAEPDLIVTHPQTLGALRRQKDSQGKYLLDVVRGAGGIDQTSEVENIWGVEVRQTTQCPAGTAIVMSIAAGAAVGWVRVGLTVEFNPYSATIGGTDLWTTNQYSWRAEERISLSAPRPAAICVVTGLPTA
jgi:Phage capsid family